MRWPVPLAAGDCSSRNLAWLSPARTAALICRFLPRHRLRRLPFLPRRQPLRHRVSLRPRKLLKLQNLLPRLRPTTIRSPTGARKASLPPAERPRRMSRSPISAAWPLLPRWKHPQPSSPRQRNRNPLPLPKRQHKHRHRQNRLRRPYRQPKYHQQKHLRHRLPLHRPTTIRSPAGARMVPPQRTQPPNLPRHQRRRRHQSKQLPQHRPRLSNLLPPPPANRQLRPLPSRQRSLSLLLPHQRNPLRNQSPPTRRKTTPSPTGHRVRNPHPVKQLPLRHQWPARQQPSRQLRRIPPQPRQRRLRPQRRQHQPRSLPQPHLPLRKRVHRRPRPQSSPRLPRKQAERHGEIRRFPARCSSSWPAMPVQ